MTTENQNTTPEAKAASPIPPTDTQLLDYLNLVKKSLHHISLASTSGTAKAEGWYVDGVQNLSRTAREAIAAIYPGGSPA
jgi:aconitase A